MRRRAPKDEAPQEWWERIRRLEGEMEQLQLAWEETYGKVRRALANLARKQALELEQPGESEAPPANHHGPLSPQEAGRLLRASRAHYGR